MFGVILQLLFLIFNFAPVHCFFFPLVLSPREHMSFVSKRKRECLSVEAALRPLPRQLSPGFSPEETEAGLGKQLVEAAKRQGQIWKWGGAGGLRVGGRMGLTKSRRPTSQVV